jgi:hypothetical protein
VPSEKLLKKGLSSIHVFFGKNIPLGYLNEKSKAMYPLPRTKIGFF